MEPRDQARSQATASSYRGVVLDLLVVTINLFIGSRAATWIEAVIRDAPTDQSRGVIAGLFMLLMLALPPSAVVLKRRRTHARLAAEAERTGIEKIRLQPGCLFNPLMYFCVSLVLGCGVMAGLGPLVFGPDLVNRGEVFISLILLVIVGSVVQTVIVYRYFDPLPETSRPSSLLDSPAAELIGDACVYLNVVLFQVLWLAIAIVPFEPVTGFQDAIGRLFFVSFAALLVYFPPRMLYLVEELRYPLARITLLAAAAAMVYRFLIGAG